MLVALREGCVPCRRWAQVLLKSEHSGCIANHADLVVNGSFAEPSKMLDTDKLRTTESIDCVTNEQIWQLGSMRSEGLRLEWSEGRMAAPATWRTVTWYLLTVDKNVYPMGWQKTHHDIVCLKPSRTAYCPWEHNMVLTPELCKGCNVWQLSQLTKPQSHKEAMIPGTYAIWH